jgi:phosphoribosyl 1,2-cyclic phosphodiesterase
MKNSSEGGQVSGSRELKICVLGSGSRGNSIFVGCGDTRVLLDAGFAGSEIRERLALIGERPERLDAVILTHEHADHVQGAGVLSRRYGVPIYANRMTLEAAGRALGKLQRVVLFQPGSSFQVNDILVEPFTLPHDAQDPVGLVMRWNGRKVSVVMDLGTVTHLVRERSEGSDLLILEFNHDPGMLKEGPYPWSVKQRIKSRLGHLSNEDSAELLRGVAHSDLRHVFLAHLSQHNNDPELALLKAAGALRGCGAVLGLTHQQKISETVYI